MRYQHCHIKIISEITSLLLQNVKLKNIASFFFLCVPNHGTCMNFFYTIKDQDDEKETHVVIIGMSIVC